MVQFFLIFSQEKLGSLQHETVSSLGVGIKPVVSVPSEIRAIDAFSIMNQQRVSAVAVLNEDGTLLTNLSAKDIKVRKEAVVSLARC